MKDITIGIRPYRSGTSAYRYCEYPEAGNFISQNSELYWCTEDLTRTTIFIMKDTKEGIELKKMLEDKVPVKDIKAYLINLTLKEITAEELINIIENKCKRAFDKGVRSNQEQLKKVMGLY